MTSDLQFSQRMMAWGAWLYTAPAGRPLDDWAEKIIRDIRADERERCIAAMVASQDPGMREVMEQRYREIMDAARTTPAAMERREPH